MDNRVNAFAEAERLYTGGIEQRRPDGSAAATRCRPGCQQRLEARARRPRARAYRWQQRQSPLDSVFARNSHSAASLRPKGTRRRHSGWHNLPSQTPRQPGLETAAAEGLTSLSATFAEKGLLDQAEAEAEKAVKIANERRAKRTWRGRDCSSQRRAGCKAIKGTRSRSSMMCCRFSEEPLPQIRAVCPSDCGASARSLGQLEQSRQMSSDVLAMADTLHDDGRAAIAASDLARVTALLGQYHDALALRERAEATYRRLGTKLALPYALGNHAELLIRLWPAGDANRVLAELEAGIERGIEAYVGRTRRAAFLRGFSAATALRCEEALRDLSKVSQQPGANEQTSVVAPGVTASVRQEWDGRHPVPPVPSDSDRADIAERAYWLAIAGSPGTMLAASGVAAAEA
jgi:tetratricopeptide (TPR) repeat protein